MVMESKKYVSLNFFSMKGLAVMPNTNWSNTRQRGREHQGRIDKNKEQEREEGTKQWDRGGAKEIEGESGKKMRGRLRGSTHALPEIKQNEIKSGEEERENNMSMQEAKYTTT